MNQNMIDYCSCCVYYTQLGCDSKVTCPYGADEDGNGTFTPS